MKKLSLFALLLLGGCYATAEPLFLPDGSSGYRISCGGYIGTMADCIEEAGDMCSANGYQMFDQAGRPLSTEAQNQAVITALNNSASKHSTDTQQNMFIKCKTNDAPLHMTPAPPPPQVEMKPVDTKPAPATPAADTAPIPLENK